VGVVGPGRAGTGLALAWAQAGHDVRLHGRRPKPVPHPLTLTAGAADQPPPWLAAASVVVLAVPDDAIAPLARALARTGSLAAHQVVLHLSGLLDREALAPLSASGAALGSLHPLQTLVEPAQAPAHLRGAWAAVEGTPHAIATAERLARDIGLRPFLVRPEDKARYHAGAVFASNYFVVVEAIAQDLLRSTGLSEEDAWSALAPLVGGTLDNLASQGPLGALTGPVARGDAETVARHLAVLSGDQRELYRQLGKFALDLARRRGLEERAAGRVARALATDPRPGRPAER
jgi:predicted short-subunit dehydrogenase-like oxidoreductase (DUF2520 family)